MSGFITQDGANYFLDLFSASETAVPTYYVALISGSAPGMSIRGDELDEPAAADYARGTLTNVSGNWNTFSGVLSNTVEIDFPLPSTDWGTISAWAVCDDPIGGRVLFAGIMDAFATTVGVQVYLPAGALSVALELTGWSDYQ